MIKVLFHMGVAVLLVLFPGCVGIQVNELIETGRLNQAAEHCSKLEGGERKDCYALLSDAFLARRDYDTAVDHYIKANEVIVFQDHFTNNKNKWFERTNEKVSNKVQHGGYFFEHKRRKGSWFSWPKFDVNINESKDFKIEYTISKIDGVDNYSYDMAWGIKDTDNCYTFGVSGNGSYIFGKFEEGKWKAVIDWTKSSQINKGNARNTLGVSKVGDTLNFYINGYRVAESPFQHFFGKKIGVCLTNKMKVNIEHIVITQVPNKKEVYKTFLENRLTNGDDLSFLNHCAKAGYSKNEAHVKIAEYYLANSNSQSAAYHLEKAGWSIRNPDEIILLEEHFNDNQNGWFEGTDEKVACRIQNGQYFFEHKRDAGGWFSWSKELFNINESGDFRIESTITKIDGIEDHFYSIVWGLKDGDNFYAFGITGDGHFKYCKELNGVWKNMINWTKSPYINKSNLTNTLAVEKSGDILKLYINGHFVAEHPYEKFLGQKVGFLIYCKMKVEIDHITVTQFPPKILSAIESQPFHEESEQAIEYPEDTLLRRDVTPDEIRTKR